MGTGDPFGSAAALQQWLDQEDAWMRATVREHGWAIQAIFGTGCWGHPACDCDRPRCGSPPFAYTVGLCAFGHPELVIFGLGIDQAHAVLNSLGDRVRGGHRFNPDETVTFDCWPHRLRLLPFRDDGDLPVLVSAQRFYQRTQTDPVPTMQCVWGDRWGRFPWDPGYDPPSGLQPMPGTSDPR